MTSINWTKARQDNAIRFKGAVDKVTEREWREKDRAALWLEKVEASQPKKPFKAKGRKKSPKRTEQRETTQ